MAVNIRLVNKGRSVAIGVLAQQGRVSVGLARTHATELAEYGWSTSETDALDGNVTALTSASSVRADAAGHAMATTAAEHAAVAGALAFIRHVRNAISIVLRDGAVDGVDRRAFRAGGKLKRSTPAISRFLVEIRGPVAKLDAKLAPYFKGALPSVELDKVKKALDDADAAQEGAAVAVPAETMKVYELKGTVLEMIQNLNRVARNAFDAKPEQRGTFNKEILKRGGGAKKTAPAPVPAPTPAAPRLNGVTSPPPG